MFQDVPAEGGGSGTGSRKLQNCLLSIQRKWAFCLFLVCFYTTFVFQSIFTYYLTLHFGTETLSKRTNSPVGELLFLGEMDL